MIKIHTGTNDIQNKVNTLQKARKVITTIKEVDVKNEYRLLSQGLFTAMIKASRKKLRKSTEIYVREFM